MLKASWPAGEAQHQASFIRPRVVLDPWLCLHPMGPVLVERLQPYVELWVVRELWSILDNSQFYLDHPEALASEQGELDTPQLTGVDLRRLLAHPCAIAPRERPTACSSSEESSENSLYVWERVRSSSDLLGLRLFWAGESLAESMFAPGTPRGAQLAYERAASTLDRVLAPRTPIACGQRDALALSVALGGIPILGLAATSVEGQTEPQRYSGLCRTGSLTMAPAPDDHLSRGMRDRWWTLLSHANVAPLIWSGLRLSLLQVHAPLLLGPFCSEDGDEPTHDEAEAAADVVQHMWTGSVIYWQAL